MEFLGDRGAAQHATTLDDAHRHAGAGEIRGAGEAVVTAAQDDGIEAACGGRHARLHAEFT